MSVMKSISNNYPSFPSTRLRRIRSSCFSKLISSENNLSVNDLIMPLFIFDGHGVREEIKSMPGIYRYSLDNLPKIIDRATGEITYGKVPAYSVVVPGSLPNKSNPDRPSLYCAVIVKKVDSKTRSKTSINDLLRD